MSDNRGVYVLRLMTELATKEAARVIGANGCWLVVAVARKQDQLQTDRPVLLWLEEICGWLGYSNKKDARRIRDKAVEAGWLKYEPPPNGSLKAGQYQVLIPGGFLSPTVPQTGYGTESTVPEMGHGSGHGSGHHSLLDLDPSPSPSPISCASASDAEGDSELADWIAWWNGLKAEGLVNAGVDIKPSKGIVAGWKRVKRSTELKRLLADRNAVREAIANSGFVRGPWFTLPKLFGGTNKEGDYYAQKLMSGDYAESSAKVPASRPGVNFDASYNYEGAF